MAVLVTGAGGFLGGYLVRHLLARGETVHALALDDAVHLPGHPALQVVSGDVTDAAAVDRLVEKTRPVHLYHLAAQSFPEASWAQPARTFEINILGTLNLLEAVRAHAPACRLVLAGSSAEYAPTPDEEMTSETSRLGPSSLYGVSKLAQGQMARLYAARHGLDVIQARPFALVGPGKEGDVASDFARRVVAVRRGEREVVPVGNLEIVRDFLDVRAGAEAFVTLARAGEGGGVYNVCSGQGHALREVLDLLKRLAKVEASEEVDPALVRRTDEQKKIGDARRLRALGWAPRYALETTLKDILEYWLAA